MAAIGRRLTGLRQLHLLGAQHLEEVALEQLAGKGGGYRKGTADCEAGALGRQPREGGG